MGWKSFDVWLEGKDIFGFEKHRMSQAVKSKEKSEDPIRQFSVERMMDHLATRELGARQPYLKFVNEIHWGVGPGSIRVWLGTAYTIIIERQNFDLEGNPVWFTKKTFQINRSGFGGYEAAVAEDIYEVVKRIDLQNIESPSREIKTEDVQRIVHKVASAIRRTARDIFIWEGIREVNENDYIIKMGVRGHGIEAQDHRRVEQNQTRITYYPNKGIIRIMNYNVESSMAQHEWAIMGNDLDVVFTPTQSTEEIAEVLATSLHWY